jgi:hypothetical protein
MIQLHRHLAFPKNVYIHAVHLDEGRIEDAHYGVFVTPRTTLADAQTAQTKMMIGELPKAPARVLAIGYGVGTTVRALRRAGYRVTVVTNDVNEGRIAQKDPIPGVEVIESPFELYYAKKQPYDAVFSREVGRQLDIVALMRAAHGHLVKGGRLVLAEDLPAEIAREAGKAAQHLGYSVLKQRSLAEAVGPTLDHLHAAVSKTRARLRIELRMTDDAVEQFLATTTERRKALKSGTLDYVLLTLIKQ